MKKGIRKVRRVPITKTSVGGLAGGDLLWKLILLADLKVDFVGHIDIGALRSCAAPLRRLWGMVGLQNVKTQIARQVLYFLQGLHSGSDYLNCAIYGPPGTGKTMLAEIIGDIYVSMGILKGSGGLKKIKREDLVAGYVGQTALKTKKVLKASLGGVLFLDEAYSLGGDGGDKNDSFAKEAVDTMNVFLSENRGNFCLIIAGYEEDIKRNLMTMNKGFERRFQWCVDIKPYSDDELRSMVSSMARESAWEIEQKALNLVFAKKFVNNGGDVERVLTNAKINRALTLACEGGCDARARLITEADMAFAIRSLPEFEVKALPPVQMYL